MHAVADYTEAIEWNIRRYTLNDYDIEADEVNKKSKGFEPLYGFGCKRFAPESFENKEPVSLHV